MDLAASATFVAEPMEAGSMHRPPRDPKLKFVDQEMMTEIILAGLSLTAAVLFNYLTAYYGGKDATVSRTIAFATWMVGHIFLAFTMRSQHETLLKSGILTNSVMLIWSAAVVVFLLVITNIIELNPLMRVTTLTGMEWIWVVAVPFVTVFWHEIAKMIKK
jgi:Ca2+-transporting ATPase